MNQTYVKYKPFPQVDIKNRQWPNKTIEKAPIWCSVDLRDGNQALIEPMGLEKKVRMFEKLVKIGYKEIEVGFPSASSTEYDFLRHIIEKNLIPDDVCIQVLVQSRAHLIEKTFEALKGAKNVILHFYNSTSEMQRRIVFKKDREGVKKIATDAAKLIKKMSQDAISNGMNLRYEYSPESFTQTELDFAIDICEAVLDELGANVENKVIINLPATVEVATPNVYADQIEWMAQHFTNRNRVILSVHPHNDRGTGVAATELALLAGADRVEGTLFGNGERTGNVCLVTVGMNMLTQGVDPKIDYSDINSLIEVYEYCNQLNVPERHPYAGDLVFTAFSGSHQDAINKGLQEQDELKKPHWDVPYLPIDPGDLGRTYETVIRINSQSGKGGIAYVMKTDYGIKIPKPMQIDFAKHVQALSDKLGVELSSKQIYDEFYRVYIDVCDVKITHSEFVEKDDKINLNGVLEINNNQYDLIGSGIGKLDALMCGLNNIGVFDNLKINDFYEHALVSGCDSPAIAYVEILHGNNVFYGSGIDDDSSKASIKAIVSALNQILRNKNES